MVDTAAETVTESIRCAVRFPLRLREALLRASFRTLESLRPYLRFPVTPVHPPYTAPNAIIRLRYDVLHEIQKNAVRNRPENRTGAERKNISVDCRQERRPIVRFFRFNACAAPSCGVPRRPCDRWSDLGNSPKRMDSASGVPLPSSGSGCASSASHPVSLESTARSRSKSAPFCPTYRKEDGH